MTVYELRQLLAEMPLNAIVVNYDNEYGKWYLSQRVVLTASGHVSISEYGDDELGSCEEVEVTE